MKSKLRRSVWTISGRLHDVQIQYGSGRLTTTSLGCRYEVQNLGFLGRL